MHLETNHLLSPNFYRRARSSQDEGLAVLEEAEHSFDDSGLLDETMASAADTTLDGGLGAAANGHAADGDAGEQAEEQGEGQVDANGDESQAIPDESE